MSNESFVCEDVFTISGRGNVMAGSADGVFLAGELIECAGVRALVTGVERQGFRATPIGILTRLGLEDLQPGQIWRKVQLDPNSAGFWLPRLQQHRLSHRAFPIPSTMVVPYEHQEAVAAIEDGADWPAWPTLVSTVLDAVGRLGPPAFIRTDLASAKHDGPESYRARTKGDVERVLSLTIQDSEIKFWPTGPYPVAFLVRAWLDLPAPFTAFGGHPIAREWRYFATVGAVVCRHFYWPEQAIAGADIDAWQESLAVLAAGEPPPELDQIAIAAVQACAEGAPEWSVDFAQDRDGRWHLIDMATAESSWHPEHA